MCAVAAFLEECVSPNLVSGSYIMAAASQKLKG